MVKQSVLARGVRKGLSTSWELVKVIAPVSLIVTGFKHTALLPWLSALCEPLMRWLGLSGEAAIVLVLGNTVGLYPAIGAMASLNLSAKELLILSLMLSFSHNLLVETAVTKRLGLSYWGVMSYRVSLALVAALLVNAGWSLLGGDALPAAQAGPAGFDAALVGTEDPGAGPSGPAGSGGGPAGQEGPRTDLAGQEGAVGDASGREALRTELDERVSPPIRPELGSALRIWAARVAADAVQGLSRTIALMIAIVVPLMVVIEALKAKGTLERLSRRIEPYMGWLGMSGKACFPLLAGVVFGLAYGAGVILDAAKEGGLTVKDRRLLCVFLVACHAAIEDTVLFIPLGVNPVLLLGTRLSLALLLTFAAARSGVMAALPGNGMRVNRG